MTLKRVPSFSGRPGFPVGLQVVLVEQDASTRAKVEQQLKQLSYEVTSCSSCSEAVATLRDASRRFDVLLVEAKAVTQSSEGQQFVQAVNGLPLVLMADGGSTGEVWKGIEMGAADVMEKPLSLLKLRNIWQHVVRKMMDTEGKEATPLKPELVKQKSFSQPSSPRSILATPATTSTTDGVSDSSLIGSKGSKSGDGDAVSVSGAPESGGADGSIESRPQTRRCSSLDNSRQKGKKGKDEKSAPGTVTHRPPLAIRPSSYMPQGAGMMPGWGPHPSMQGCVWGTPLPHGGTQAPFPGAQQMPPTSGAQIAAGWHMPLQPMGSCSLPMGYQMGAPGSPLGMPMQRCFSAPGTAHNALPPPGIFPVDSTGDLEDLERSLSLGDDCCDSLLLDGPLLLPDELPLLAGEDLTAGMPGCHASLAPMPVPILDGCMDTSRPPIGLQLKKSESFVNLINAHLRSSCTSLCDMVA